MTDTTRSQSVTAHPGVEARVPDGVPLVFALKAPAPASAYDRAVWGCRIEGPSAETGAPLPSQGLRIATVTGVPQTGVDDDHGAQSADEVSSGPPSPDPSSPGLRTPMDSPPTSRALATGKDDVPDIGHLFIHDRAARPSLSGPSFVTGDAAIGVVVTRHLNASQPMGSQMYHLPMMSLLAILEREGDYKSAKTHKLFIDTGSDDTFGFGQKPFAIGTPHEQDNMDLEERGPWSQDKILDAPSHTFLSHEFDPSLSNRELRRRGLTIGRIHYADNALAHVGLLQPRTCVLYCYDPDRKRRYEVYLKWRFGVAFAINEKLLFDHTSGMLGLGLTGIQHAYKYHSLNVMRPPSFLTVLQTKLPPIPADRTEEEIAMFFCLRMAPDCYPDGRPGEYPIQSWMSFNVWPCQMQPAWNTTKIAVCDSRPHHKRWAVYLRSIRFARVDATLHRPVPGHSGLHNYPMDSSLVFVDENRPRGLLVDLDTGSSVTYLPLDAVQRINKNLFRNKEAVKYSKGPPSTYEVNPDSWIFKAASPVKIQVIYEFEGVGGSDPVYVDGPFERFAYQLNPVCPKQPEGLIFPSEESYGTDRGTLGLNFFQTMYVSLHKAADGLDFVRMAGQWPEDFAEDLERYFVRGASGL